MLAAVKECIKQGGSIYENSTPSFDMATPIHLASRISARTGDTTILKYLLSIAPLARLRAVVNAKDAFGNTPLHYAVKADLYNGSSTATTNLLVTAGANINARDDNGITPLYLATLFLNIGVVKALVGLGADVNIPFPTLNVPLRDHTPLDSAIDSENLGIVKILLKAGANWQARDAEGETPYDRATGEVRKYLKLWEEKYWMAAGVALHRRFPTNIARSIMQKARH